MGFVKLLDERHIDDKRFATAAAGPGAVRRVGDADLVGSPAPGTPYREAWLVAVRHRLPPAELPPGMAVI